MNGDRSVPVIRTKLHPPPVPPDYVSRSRLDVARLSPVPLTTLTGRISDQAELNGVVNSIFEMHLPILSVEAMSDEAVHTDAEPDQKVNELE